MSLLLDASALSVSPRVLLVPDAADSEGGLACDLAASYGLTPFDWQRSALVGLMGVRPDGRWAASRAGIVVPRQNGKNGAAEIYELWVTSQLGMRVLHSAHEVKTARKAFKRLLDFYDSPRLYPELRALVKEIRRTNGQEAIELHNGGSVEFLARTKSSGRGYSADVLLLDEAQELAEDEIEAMQPTISASQNAQIILMGTAPKATKPAPVWRRLRQAGIDGTDRRLFWVDYSATPEDDFASRDVWALANPGAPVSITWQAVEDEFAVMSLEGFAAERLGVWFEQDLADGIVDLALWSALSIGNDVEMVAPVWAVEVALDRSRATIGAAWLVAGKPHLEMVDQRAGVDWAVPRLAELAAEYGANAVVLDGGTEAAQLEPALDAAGLQVERVAGPGRAAACGAFYDLASSAALTHNGDPILALALASARWKDAEGTRAFGRRKSAGDISALYAVTLALHGLLTSPPADPGVYII